MKSSLFSLLVLFLFAIPLFSHAQIPDLQALKQQLTVSVSPEYPQPNSPVTVSIESYTYDLNSSDISWTLNGTVIAHAIGEKSVTFNTGAIGHTDTLAASVVVPTGQTFTQSIPVTPTSVAFLTEGDTYTPPFYEGRSLYTSDGSIVVTAVPQIGSESGIIDPSKLVYKWTQDEKVLDDQSGYGKQSVTMSGNFWGRDSDVIVDVSTLGGDVVAENTLTLHPVSPELLIYDNDPLLGYLSNHAITGTFGINKNTEASFFAAPYGFITSFLPKTTYNWTMNGQVIAGSANSNTVTFRGDGTVSGTSNIAVSANQPGTNFESASNGFSIKF